MFNFENLIKQIRYNEINCIDLCNETVPDYSKIPVIRILKLSGDLRPNEGGHWSNTTALTDNNFACNDNRHIYIWNADSKECISILEGQERVLGMLSMPDGRLLSVHKGNTVEIWLPIEGKYLGRLLEQAENISSIALLPNNCIATGSDDDIIRMWHVDSKQLIMPMLFGNKMSVKYLVSYQESYLVSMDLFNNLIIWYTDAVEKHQFFHMDIGDLMSFQVDYTGNILFGNTKGFIYRVKPRYTPNLHQLFLNEDIICTLPGSVFVLKKLVDGKIMALTSENKIYYIDQYKNHILNIVECNHIAFPHTIDVLTDGRIIANGDKDEMITLTYPLRTVNLDDISPLISELKNNHSVSEIKIRNDQINDVVINQLYNIRNKKRDLKIICVAK